MTGSPTEDETRIRFDVELERTPNWLYGASAAVVVVSVLVAAHVVHMLVLLPFLVASSVGRRFGVSPLRVEVRTHALDLGEREIATAKILDVWFDDDEADPRVTVAFGVDVEVASLHFIDREQGRRFHGALVATVEGRPHVVVAGTRPRLVDALASLRFVAIAGAFFATGSRLGLCILVFFALGAWSFLRARQVVANDEGFELRGPFGTKRYGYTLVEAVDVEDGLVRLRGGAVVELPRGTLRDSAMTSPPWLVRARARVLEHVRSRSLG